MSSQNERLSKRCIIGKTYGAERRRTKPKGIQGPNGSKEIWNQLLIDSL